jgi:hypothetical protein
MITREHETTIVSWSNRPQATKRRQDLRYIRQHPVRNGRSRRVPSHDLIDEQLHLEIFKYSKSLEATKLFSSGLYAFNLSYTCRRFKRLTIYCNLRNVIQFDSFPCNDIYNNQIKRIYSSLPCQSVYYSPIVRMNACWIQYLRSKSQRA